MPEGGSVTLWHHGAIAIDVAQAELEPNTLRLVFFERDEQRIAFVLSCDEARKFAHGILRAADLVAPR